MWKIPTSYGLLASTGPSGRASIFGAGLVTAAGVGRLCLVVLLALLNAILP